MWGLITTTFLVIYCLMSFYIGRRGWQILGKTKTRSKIIYGIVLGLLILAFPMTEMVQNWLPQTFAPGVSITGWYAMIAVVYLFFLLMIVDSVRLLDRRIPIVPRIIRDHDRTPKAVALLILGLITVTLIYGSWNARHPDITHYELSIDKEVGTLKQLRIVMVSDIHYGEIIDEPRLNGMLEAINQLQPDVIVMAGDIVDGRVNQEEFQKLIDILKQMNSNYGTYIVPGNHDRWISSVDSVRDLEEAGIVVLRDRHINVGDSFYIIGRDDPGHRRDQGRKGLEELMQGVDQSLPLILLDHQPINLEEAEKNGIDLQLSGHTHMGQIFPSHIITRQLYAIDWGLLTRGSYHLIVSSGYGTWGPPLRIGTNSEIVEVILKFPR
ncbi:MAG TPA: metallophosphoesterase [Desulfosporosinus sp.]|nr:metallophosphoesterase [Desulfosporosinus sp.]